jgi:hypothetical protein
MWLSLEWDYYQEKTYHMQHWWHTSATLVAYISNIGGIHQQHWWHTSAALVAYISNIGGIHQQHCWHTSATLLAYLGSIGGIHQQHWWHTSATLVAYISNTTIKQLLKRKHNIQALWKNLINLYNNCWLWQAFN